MQCSYFPRKILDHKQRGRRSRGNSTTAAQNLLPKIYTAIFFASYWPYFLKWKDKKRLVIKTKVENAANSSPPVWPQPRCIFLVKSKQLKNISNVKYCLTEVCSWFMEVQRIRKTTHPKYNAFLLLASPIFDGKTFEFDFLSNWIEFCLKVCFCHAIFFLFNHYSQCKVEL